MLDRDEFTLPPAKLLGHDAAIEQCRELANLRVALGPGGNLEIDFLEAGVGIEPAYTALQAAA